MLLEFSLFSAFLLKYNRVTVTLSCVIAEKNLYVNLLKILVCCNLSFTRSLNVFCLKMER